MKLVTAIIRSTSLDGVVGALDDAGYNSITISDVKGTGEEVVLNKRYGEHKRIDLYLDDGQADAASRMICEHAATGFAGDGFVAVQPVDVFLKIRSGKKRE